MDNYEKVLEQALNILMGNANATTMEPKTDLNTSPINSAQLIPVGISNRHVHLSQEALDKLFGDYYSVNILKELSQPGQYACKECVTICGPKGAISNVRILGPVRPETQVEILQSDTFQLGINTEVRLSGKLENTAGITLVGPKGSLEISQGVIVAQRHIHMLPQDAQAFHVVDGENVTIKVNGLRGGVLDNVAIRVTNQSNLECHIDTEEANALGIRPKDSVQVIK